jgi:hypothetical protein
MARQVKSSISATGNSGPVFLSVEDSTRWFAIVPSGVTVSYKLQYTADDLQNPDAPTAVWFDDAAAPAGTTASSTGFYVGPSPTALRLVLNGAATGGSLRLITLQGSG